MSYDNDCRVRAAKRNSRQAKYYTVSAECELQIKPDGREAWEYRHYDEGFEEGAVPDLFDDLPVRPGPWEVCGMCRGNGKVVDPAIDSHGLGREDFDEDPDFAEGYFGGRYDIPCPECGGRRVTRDYEPAPGEYFEMTKKFLDIVEDLLADAEDYDEVCAAERRMGA